MANKSKFNGTKEPWLLIGKTPNTTTIKAHGVNGEVARVFAENDISKEEMEANAKLLVCAPRMLEALKEFVRMYEKVQPAGGWQGVYEEGLHLIEKATS